MKYHPQYEDPMVPVLLRLLMERTDVKVTDTPLQGYKKVKKYYQSILRDALEEDKKLKKEFEEGIKKKKEEEAKKNTGIGINPIVGWLFFMAMSPLLGLGYLYLLKELVK